jgi:hypothetical protein
MQKPRSPEHSTVSEPTRKSVAASPTRRRFLFALGAGSAGAAAATAVAMPAAIAPETTAPDNQDAAYRESEHVRDYYRTTRI